MNKLRKSKVRTHITPESRRVLEIQFLMGPAIIVILMVHAAGDVAHLKAADLSVVSRALGHWLSINPGDLLYFPLTFTLTLVMTYAAVSWISRTPLSDLLLGKTVGAKHASAE